MHSEFKGEKLDLYTDGTRWASGEAARQENSGSRQELRPQRPEDLPYGWDQGRNVIGAKPDRSPGDTSDLPPTGQELLDARSDTSKKREARQAMWDEGDDVIDVVQNNADDIDDIFIPQPTGSYSCNPMPTPGPYFTGQPHAAADVGVGAATLLVLGLTAERGINWVREHWRLRSKGDSERCR